MRNFNNDLFFVFKKELILVESLKIPPNVIYLFVYNSVVY